MYGVFGERDELVQPLVCSQPLFVPVVVFSKNSPELSDERLLGVFAAWIFRLLDVISENTAADGVSTDVYFVPSIVAVISPSPFLAVILNA